MKGITVTLTDMLACRERRACLQKELIEKYRCPILSFSMNIPGPIKTTPDIQRAFEAGKQVLFAQLDRHGLPILSQKEFHEATGDELLWAVKGSAEKIKEITTEIEETHPLGRLFDMDIIGTNGEKLSRGTWRTCLICGCQAQECARSRRHTIAEMQAKIDEMLICKSGTKGDDYYGI